MGLILHAIMDLTQNGEIIGQVHDLTLNQMCILLNIKRKTLYKEYDMMTFNKDLTFLLSIGLIQKIEPQPSYSGILYTCKYKLTDEGEEFLANSMTITIVS